MYRSKKSPFVSLVQRTQRFTVQYCFSSSLHPVSLLKMLELELPCASDKQSKTWVTCYKMKVWRPPYLPIPGPDPGSTPPCNLQEHDPAQSLLMFPYVSIRLPEIILRFRNKIYITRKKHLSALTINTTNQTIDVIYWHKHCHSSYFINIVKLAITI